MLILIPQQDLNINKYFNKQNDICLPQVLIEINFKNDIV